MSDPWRPRHVLPLLWNLAVIFIIYTLAIFFGNLCARRFILQNLQIFQAIELGNEQAPAVIEYIRPEVVDATFPKVRIKFQGLRDLVRIDRYANVFNRPASKVDPHDNYLGPRPHVDTEIDFEALMKGCRGDSVAGAQFRNTSRCLEFLREYESAYTRLPPEGVRASNRDPRMAEFPNSDGLENTRESYVTVEAAQPSSRTRRGTCPGPIVPYHVYWRGPATWRVEIFVKSYLYTQNLACSQLNIWLDSDSKPGAVASMYFHDPLFARFVPLVDRGDIILRSWNFPNRISFPELYEENPILVKRSWIDRTTQRIRSMDQIKRTVLRTRHENEMVFSQREKAFLPVAVSDAVRFVVLHLYGGGYFDMDVLMLRDMRPFYLPLNHSFAERWSTYTNGGFNTAIMSLTANSSLSTYLLQGGVKMGLNFHPLVLGIMSRKDGRNQELQMLEHGVFDPLWSSYAGNEIGPCPVPCFQGDYSKAFKGTRDAIKDEWEGYQEAELRELSSEDKHEVWTTDPLFEDVNLARRPQKRSFRKTQPTRRNHRDFRPQIRDVGVHEHVDENFLFDSDIILDYSETRDRWPPNNRTLENFFRGAYTYHIHNQWDSRPEPSSWLNVIEQAHDRFFEGKSTNPYGEKWTGPPLPKYPKWAEFL